MGFYQQYKLEIKNIEGVQVKAIIEDTLSPETNPYGLAYTRVNDPGPNQTITVTFTSIPAACTGTRIVALDNNGGLIGDSGVLGTTSPVSWSSCPDGDHVFLFFFIIPVPGDDELFVLNELEGITDELTGGNYPFRLRSDNNQENKLQTLVGTILQMQFESTSENNLNKLLRGTYSDRRYRVTAYITAGGTDRVFFRGYLQMADAQEAFMPHPNTIQLTATCGLGSLKNKPLKDTSGNNPSGYYKLIQFIAWCLKKTGVERNINVVMNIKESEFRQFAEAITFTAPHKIIFNSNRNVFAGQVLDITGTASNDGQYTISSVAVVGFTKEATVVETVVNESPGPVQPSIWFLNNNFYNYLYQNSKTWETEVGESDDCFTVLEKILAPICRLGQRHGEWWIKNLDEYDDPGDYVVVFDKDGNWVENKDLAEYEKSIGFTESMKWSQEGTGVAFKSPARYAKLSYRFENPKEVPCNVDFERGDYIADIDSDSKKYELECWDKLREAFGGGDTAATTDIFIQRDFVNDYENARYVVFKSTTPGNFIRSETIPVKEKDKISIGLTRRMSADVSGSGFYRDIGMQVRLYASDGTFWALQGETSAGDVLSWVQTDAVFNSPAKFLYFEGDASDDLSQSQSLYGSGDSPEIPREGYIRICCHQSHMTTGDWPGKDTYLERLSFEYFAYINGSHQKYTGQFHKVSQANDNDVEKVDEQVYISDSPSRLPKGALHKPTYNDYQLSELFWNAAKSPAGPGSSGSTQEKPYVWHCLFAVWNQVWMLQRIFRGSIQGIESDSVDALDRCDLPSIFHHYRLTDADEQTNEKKFMLLSYDMDLYRCEFAQASFIEVHQENVGKKYTDAYEFKYLTR